MTKQVLEGFGILNSNGRFWSSRYFYTRGDAETYMMQCEREHQDCDLSRHIVVPVKMEMIASEQAQDGHHD